MKRISDAIVYSVCALFLSGLIVAMSFLSNNLPHHIIEEIACSDNGTLNGLEFMKDERLLINYETMDTKKLAEEYSAIFVTDGITTARYKKFNPEDAAIRLDGKTYIFSKKTSPDERVLKRTQKTKKRRISCRK